MKMMTRRRARLIASSIVLSAVIGASIASGGPAPIEQFEITEAPAITRSRNTMATTRTVLSIRNLSGVTRVFGLASNMMGGCAQIVMTRLGTDSSINSVTLAPGEQTQFSSSSQGSSVPLSFSCQWTIMEAAAGQMFDTFHTYMAGTPDSWDLQPRSMSFRPMAGGETQRLYIQNYTAGAQTYDSARLTQTSGPAGALTFVGGGIVNCVDMTCATSGGSVAANAFDSVDVRCTLPGTVPAAGTLELVVGGNPIQTTQIMCEPSSVAGPGIALSPATLSLSAAMPSGLVNVTNTNGTNNVVMQAMLTDPSFMFAGGPCTGTAQLCNPMAGAVTPVALRISCIPDMTMTRTSTLYVTPQFGSPVMSIVECVQSSTGAPLLRVSPVTITAGPRPVGSTYTENITLTNDGAGTLVVHVEPPGSADWTTSACSPASPCQLDGNGSNATVQVTFSPIAHGNRSTSMLVVANGTMMQNVALNGSGDGAVVAVTEPTSLQGFALELGTVGLNTPATRTIRLRNNGNVSTTATLTTSGGAPFSLSTGTVSLPSSPGADTSVTVTCQSPTPLEETRAIRIMTGQNTYATEPMGLFDANGAATITAHCRVVATPVQISPELAFGEVWKGTMPRTITVTIRNPSTALTSANVTAVALTGGTQGLTLAPISPPGLPRVLAPGEEITTTLTLATGSEVDLDANMPLLAVTVDSVVLEQPISGKVVTPSARLAPGTNLDLGTACIGSDVRGTVMLINDGTATLTITRPLMDGAFTPSYVDPMTYDIDGTAQLAPMRSAIASVRPNMSAGAGRLEGTLTWNVAGPGPFTIDVFLQYIDVGAAVSPGALSFGPVTVAQMSNRQTITLENCNRTPVEVSVEGLVSRAGNLAAWDVQPRTDMRTLAPEEKMTISVAFAPTRPGPHVADLRLVVDGVVRNIPLEGDGLGVTIDRSSFYACSCQGGHAPLHGWPLVIAFALLCLPRRRRR